jgi:hypothetical protein
MCAAISRVEGVARAWVIDVWEAPELPGIDRDVERGQLISRGSGA